MAGQTMTTHSQQTHSTPRQFRFKPFVHVNDTKSLVMFLNFIDCAMFHFIAEISSTEDFLKKGCYDKSCFFFLESFLLFNIVAAGKTGCKFLS